ncbi:unnamed protein product [Lepeophtheirus salmonis]|uniref:(salmon louse) hypothetical protein n=1 Tax=Lepeophtheirus salmonis TaxID=72036 RepID=A0A7R8D3Q4_LEPSM|nr:unnamed protein product [Lepeophtheirus salmonis]CAF3018951.1 unnamed protein product [Lepeophtheirus salmonis]
MSLNGHFVAIFIMKKGMKSLIRREGVTLNINYFEITLKVGRSISCSPWSISPSRSPTFPKEEPNLSPYEHLSKITFLIKRSTFGRTGWKVMPEDIDIDMNRLPDSLLANIMGILREAELSGKAVPEKITLNL